MSERVHITLIALCIFSAFIFGVSADESFTITSPPNLFHQNHVIQERPSLFGHPNYIQQISGQIIYPTDQDGTNYGCSAYPSFAPGSGGDGLAPTLIAMIDRGPTTNPNCTFGIKVLNAQNAGAQAVVIVSDDTKFSGVLPFMSASDVLLHQIEIPAMIIHGSDGDIIKSALANNTEVIAAMSYFLPKPDDRVEMDYYTSASAGDHAGAKFQSQFETVISTMGKSVYFEPHYQILNQYYKVSKRVIDSCQVAGQNGKCTTAAINAKCANRCTNCGRYCQNDPDRNITSGASGMQVVQEQFRAKCVWLHGNETNPLQNTLWFEYVNSHATECAGKEFDEDCSYRVMTNKLGLVESEMNSIKACVGTYGLLDDTDNIVGEAELDWRNIYNIPSSMVPKLLVNQNMYNGDLSCADPLTVNCAPLQMVCAGFSTQPSVCQTPVDCKLGQQYDACGTCRDPADPSFVFNADDCNKSSGGGKFPVAAVVVIILLAVLVIAGGVYYYVRRQQMRMKDDIDQLLKQYLPLDGQTSDSASSRVDQVRLLSQETTDQI